MITGSLICCDLFRKLYLCGVNYNEQPAPTKIEPL